MKAATLMIGDDRVKVLPSLPGTAEEGLWTGTNEFGKVDLSEVIFPIFRKISLMECEIVGTGLYILRNSCFLTARHVLRHHQEDLFTVHFFTEDRKFLLRPVTAAYHHPKGDISAGVLAPVSQEISKIPLKNKIIIFESKIPAIGSDIVTYSYPLHDIINNSDGVRMNLQPEFYSGSLGEYYSERGPSAKLECPYYLADLHLYGASSGGPVFSKNGTAFAIASASYDGMNDLAFLTPIQLAGEIVIPHEDMKDGKGRRDLTLREIVEAHARLENKNRRSTF